MTNSVNQKCIALFGVISAIVLATVAAVAFFHGTVNAFMWVRAVLLLAITPVLHRLAVHAARGLRRSFDRLRTVVTVLPVAIVGVDLIPGVCPMWYAVLQGLSALPLAGLAVLLRRRAPADA